MVEVRYKGSRKRHAVKPSKNQRIINPKTGSISFGQIPPIASGDLIVPSGEIYLRHGEHSNRGNRGFGLVHIWERHSDSLQSMGYNTLESAAEFVADIIQPGSAIFSEFVVSPKIRVQVVKGQKGLAVLEEGAGEIGETVYSVVTAYRNRGMIKGTKIGALLR